VLLYVPEKNNWNKISCKILDPDSLNMATDINYKQSLTPLLMVNPLAVGGGYFMESNDLALICLASFIQFKLIDLAHQSCQICALWLVLRLFL
jgi:hypothetical protein